MKIHFRLVDKKGATKGPHSVALHVVEGLTAEQAYQVIGSLRNKESREKFAPDLPPPTNQQAVVIQGFTLDDGSAARPFQLTIANKGFFTRNRRVERKAQEKQVAMVPGVTHHDQEQPVGSVQGSTNTANVTDALRHKAQRTAPANAVKQVGCC